MIDRDQHDSVRGFEKPSLNAAGSAVDADLGRDSGTGNQPLQQFSGAAHLLRILLERGGWIRPNQDCAAVFLRCHHHGRITGTPAVAHETRQHTRVISEHVEVFREPHAIECAPR